MDLTEEIEKLKQKAVAAIEALQHQNDLQSELIVSQSKLIKLYESILKDVLSYKDTSWKENHATHDWKDLIHLIEGVLEHDKDNNRTNN